MVAITIRVVFPCGWPEVVRRAARSTVKPMILRYNIVKDPVHIRDFHCTILQLLGSDHERLTYKFQGLDQRLTGVLPSKEFEPLA